ncbi:hypothetical protein CVD25_19370 [Bacillus canaveralius]|uniref:NERD domain-containing protein n=1 Tax=Bacillus canaveralius TaxID=1403243 RepID=A0A2N5GLN6_9BACI|nr:hypothetical protein [Bacillus canaveralius]PLR82617.1 hypothetical protein CU635_11285 [Bacillus canaveralius]PLR91256.1 hypothetical protein CVD25_19370 [Bacillus canaveralius]
MKEENESLDVFPFIEIIELEKNIEESLTKIRSTISKGNPIMTMIQLHGQKFFNHFGDIEASVYGNVKPYENKLLDFTQSLIVTNDINQGTGCLNKNEITGYLEELDKLFTAASIYVNMAPKDELIKYSQGMQMNVSGTLYPFFEKEHFTDMLSPYTDLLEEIFGITSIEAVEGLLAISKHLRTMGFVEALINSGASPEEISDEVLLNIAEYFNVERITGWPIEFIQELSLQQGECKDFYENDLQVMLKETPIKYKPFIGVGDKYYCFSIDNLIDNFYRTVLRAMRRKKGSISNRINDIQKDLSEALPFKLFKTILPASQMFKSVFYKAPVGANGKNEWCECDGIILFDDVMIIIEVKGGALSPVSPFSDEEAYKKSLNDLAKNPYEQSLRFFEEYKRTGKIDIYHKESKKRYKFTTSIENIKFIQACCVTLDDFNEIASQIEKTEFIQNSDLPVWCVSVNDLRVYPELFDSPSLFLNYLYQRSHATKNPYIKLNDELDHIGMYFAYNDYCTRISEIAKEEDIEEIFIASHRDEIDAYMARKINTDLNDGEGESFYDILFGPAPKPRQEMDFMFEQLIKLLDSTKDHLCIRAARYFLLLDSYSRDNLSEFLSSRSKKLLEFKSRQAILTPYMAFNYKKEDRISELPVITIFLLQASNKLFKDVVQRKRFLMERVLYEDEPTYCILVGMNKNKELTKVITHIIGPEQFQMLPESAYELLKNTRDKIGNSRNIKEF